LANDRSEQDAAAQRLREREQLFRTLVENQAEGLGLVDQEERFMYSNPAGDAIFGVPPGALTGRSLLDFLPPSSVQAVAEQTRLRREGEGSVYEIELRRPSGEIRLLHVTATPYRSDELGFMGTFGIFRDVTEARQTERQLRLSEAKFRAIAEQLSACLFITDEHGILSYLSPAASKVFGDGAEALLGTPLCQRFSDTSQGFPSDSALRSVVVEMRRCSGESFVGELSASPFVLAERGGWLGTVRDVSERIAAQTRLRIMAELLDSAPSSITVHDANGQWLYANKRSFELHGYTEEEFLALSVTQLDAPSSAERFAERVRMLQQRGEACFEVEHFHKTGELLPMLVWAKTVDWDGQPALMSIATDLRERKKAEHDRTLLEEQLRVAQKMEAIARLAGGVAHDFNNLLSVILAYTGFVLAELDEEDPLCADLLEVQKAGERATKLTRQLLAFSRKQALELAPIDLNVSIRQLEGMLRRILGEDIGLRVSLAEQPLITLADATQIEQVIFNFVVNARDAMPKGGQLSLSTSAVDIDAEEGLRLGLEAGAYLRFAVDDTGCGISRENLSRIFDPFYTTKPVGKGTGLGLAMIYGFAKQSGGCVQVESALGRGTRFELLLPRQLGADPSFERVRSAIKKIRGNETVLLVEDEDAVRNAACRILTASGYRVLTANNAGEAKLIAQAHLEAIHLLLTDVIMPGQNGKELADALRQTRPTLRVLFMSGHDQGVLGESIDMAHHAFISKPFDAAALTKKIRALLDEDG
jgi:PAS domain S-box-containing protein